jgi:hypothetical protein
MRNISKINQSAHLLNHLSGKFNNMSKNREHFDQCTAIVFQLLYQQFPQEINITIEDLGIKIFDEVMTDNYLATMRFLQREGFIRYQAVEFDTFTGVVLTAKGLKTLDSITGEQTIAQKIDHTLEQNTQQLLNSVIREVITIN